VIRLALLYALTDGQSHIRPPHLTAALALHDYAARSAAWALTGATVPSCSGPPGTDGGGHGASPGTRRRI
jgi:hypothetical protein